jgi:hypothetical protein
MLNAIFNSKLTAIAGFLILFPAAAAFAQPVMISGGSSAVVDGWSIAPDPGISLQITSSDSGISITKTAVFTSNTPLNIKFTQIDPPSDFGFVIPSESVMNSTGTAWTGFTFSLSAPASFDSVTSIFAPPTNFTSVSLSPDATVASYSGGTQSSGTTAAWGDPTVSDEMLFSAPLAAPPAQTSFTLSEAPVAASNPGAVPLPAAAWQIGAMLTAMGLFAWGRKVRASVA